MSGQPATNHGRGSGGPTVRTVLGDVAATDLGVTDAHDHLFFASPMLPGQELDDEDAALAQLEEFRRSGGRTLVQWTPYGLRRRRSALVRLSRRGGVHLVAATGLHRAEHYATGQRRPLPDDLAGVFVADLTTAPVRAGLIKVASAFHCLDDHARLTMTAAAHAHHATGAPIGVHLERGTAGLETMELLTGLGVPPESVILGHVGRFPDLRAQLRLARTGAWLCFDGPSPANHATDWRLGDSLAGLVDAGHGGQLLIGGDTTTAAARSIGPGHLAGALRQTLTAELGEDMVRGLFVDNPATALAAQWR